MCLRKKEWSVISNNDEKAVKMRSEKIMVQSMGSNMNSLQIEHRSEKCNTNYVHTTIFEVLAKT